MGSSIAYVKRTFFSFFVSKPDILLSRFEMRGRISGLALYKFRKILSMLEFGFVRRFLHAISILQTTEPSQ